MAQKKNEIPQSELMYIPKKPLTLSKVTSIKSNLRLNISGVTIEAWKNSEVIT